MPLLVVVGGPNGSGKTTLTGHLMKRGRIRTSVINPDEIAIIEFGSYTYQVQAAKAALERRNLALSSKIDFAFETTFSGNSEINTVLAAKAAGYKLILYYVTLEAAVDNIIRVEERRHNRGHFVKSVDLLRRYDKSKNNLLKHFHLFDKVYLFDNSGVQRSRVAIVEKGKLLWLNPKHKEHSFYKDLFKPSTSSTSATGLNK